jgi:O-acetyl-ADP-ribose deacetylase (regulator of RNase III)
MSYQIILGDATNPQDSGFKLIPHVCNDAGGWGSGFVIALSRKWLEPEKAYREWHYSRSCNIEGFEVAIPFGLGRIQLATVSPEITVANMIAQSGFDYNLRPPIRYGALAKCMFRVLQQARRLQASIHCPKFGAGLAGGDWNVIEQMIQEIWVENDLSVTVYAFEQTQSL